MTANPDNESQPRILIVGGANPRSKGVGEQFVNGMLDGYPRDRLIRCAFNNCTESEIVDWQGSQCHVIPVESYGIPVNASWTDWKFRQKQLPNHINKISELASKNRVDMAWLFLNSLPMIHLAGQLKTQFDLPYVVTIWDAPEYLIFKSMIGPIAGRRVMEAFETALKGAAEVVSISPQMTDIYRNQYSVESRPMVFCPPLDTWQDVRIVDPDDQDRPIKVVFAGSLYAWREWNAFLNAIEIRNNESSTRPIEVTCIGDQSRWAKRPAWVNFEPLKPPAEAAAIINQSDLAYLPYWMDKKHAHFAKTAFPSKLPFYVASGTPVFFHGPEDSTPAHFIRKHPIGVSSHSANAAEILASLDSVISPKFRAEFAEARDSAMNQVFHPDRSREIFTDVIRSVASRIPGEPN